MRHILAYLLLMSAVVSASAFSAIGTVLGPDHHPIAGASIYNLVNHSPIITDAQGNFAVHVEQPSGSPVTERSAVMIVISAPGLALGGGIIENNQPATFTLGKASALQGTVADSKHHAVAGVHMVVQSFQNQERFLFIPPELAARYTAVTDAQGQFTIPGLPEDGRVWALVDDRRFAKALIQLSLNSIKK
ncbi:MAG TPA: carboxypeptidase-like regulatory domain-containing protein, partial [Armatimonadota bacterium]|nr:carboxypeptidase-like regulatory domain-containing protein [Armatimonadota bacterium]